MSKEEFGTKVHRLVSNFFVQFHESYPLAVPIFLKAMKLFVFSFYPIIGSILIQSDEDLGEVGIIVGSL